MDNRTLEPQLVSIVIPCHDAARWLAETIESVLAQTWPQVEVIVVDDGSTDGSVAIARKFEPQGVRLATQSNRGASAARNHGLRLARGEYIQFLDADDLLAPEKIARQLTALAGDPNAIASCRWGRFQAASAEAVFTPEENWRDCDPIEWLTLNFAGRGMMPPTGWLAPRSLLDRAGPWDERLTLNDDGEYFCRVLLGASRVRFVADAGAFYRSDLPHSVSRRRSPDAWRSAFLSHELCSRHLLAREDSPRTRRACADLFQRLAFAMYPDCPDLVTRCEAAARQFGGSAQRPGGGAAFQLAARLLGWKTARHWQQTRATRSSRA